METGSVSGNCQARGVTGQMCVLDVSSPIAVEQFSSAQHKKKAGEERTVLQHLIDSEKNFRRCRRFVCVGNLQ